jgi:hypothetical protein
MSTLRVNTIQTNTTSGIDVNSPLETVPSLDVTGNVTVGSNISVSGIVTAGTFSGNLTGSVNLTTGITTVSAGSTASPSISPSGDNNTGIFFPSPDTIAFGEGGAEAFRVDSSGRLLVGTTSATANGGVLELSGGITFPATAVAATNPNTLDDYEEGSWTPNQGAGLTVTGTFSSTGFYVKIGKQVTIWATVRGSTNISVASAGTNVCTNAPFTTTGGNVGSDNGAPGCGTNWSNNVLVGCCLGGTTLTATTTVASTFGIMYCVSYNVA